MTAEEVWPKRNGIDASKAVIQDTAVSQYVSLSAERQKLRHICIASGGYLCPSTQCAAQHAGLPVLFRPVDSIALFPCSWHEVSSPCFPCLLMLPEGTHSIQLFLLAPLALSMLLKFQPSCESMAEHCKVPREHDNSHIMI